MSWWLDALEIDEDADERAIKRAYAKRLRVTRPDDDPVAFQQLHEAYQAALAWAQQPQPQDNPGNGDTADLLPCTAPEETAQWVTAESLQAAIALDRQWAHGSDEGGHSGPSQPASPTPALSQDLPLDVLHFAHRIIDTASESDPDSLESWLELRPELWSLNDKPRVGARVLQLLLQQGAALREENFDVLSRFFCWDEIGSEVDPYLVRERRDQLHRYWRLQPRNNDALTAMMSRPEAPVSAREVAARMQRLSRPWHAIEALLSASVPGRVSTMQHTLELLDVHDIRHLMPPLDANQVAFWLAVSRRGQVNLFKILVAVLRSVLCTLVLLAVLGALALADDPARPRNPGTVSIADIALYGGLAVLIGGSLMMPLYGLVLWQIAPEHPRPRHWLPRLLLIPVLAVTALLLMHAADARLAGSILGWATLALAAMRLRTRGGYSIPFSPWMIFVCIPLFKLGVWVLLVGEVAVVLALVLWTIDTVSQVLRGKASGLR